MLTLPWWVFLLVTLGVFVVGQFAGAFVLMAAALKWSRREKSLGKRYPEGAE
jgi:hypothetical protein